MKLTDPKSRRGKRTLTMSVVLLVSAGVAATYFGLSYLTQSVCPNSSNLRSFLIIADFSGFNDSKDHSLTLNVQKDDCVLITVDNKDTQAHGLAVQTYAAEGIDVRPGETNSLRFYATSTGQFSITEPLFSSTYVFDNGVLNVTSG